MDIDDIINKSGYPLQLAIEKLINNTTKQHGWRVVAKEHRWADDDGHEGYIDLILEHRTYPVRVVIECKKVKGSWNFLIPEVNPEPYKDSVILKASYSTQSLAWVNSRVMHSLLEAAYCVTEVEDRKGNSTPDNRTIEQIAGELLLATEAQAKEEICLYPSDPSLDKYMFYFPVIVAATTLRKVLFSPENVDIENGMLTASAVDAISYIRLRKALASNAHKGITFPTTIGEINKENERVVFVVQSGTIVDFLAALTWSIDAS